MLCAVLTAGFCCQAVAECPILIKNLQQLDEVRNDLDGWYVLAEDINAVETSTWNGGEGFKPIGNYNTPFTGIFDGQGYSIDGLYMNHNNRRTGLFGATYEAEIINVNLTNADITGHGAFGGILVADCNNSSIECCFSSGLINCTVVCGGLFGFCEGPNTVISHCNSSAVVLSNGNCGGLVGGNGSGSTISYCYATGNVIGSHSDYELGGLAGSNSGIINDCYSTGDVNGFGEIGGLVGDNTYGIVERCYSTGLVIADVNEHKGGLIGYVTYEPNDPNDPNDPNSYHVYDSYWDVITSDCNTSYGGIDSNTIMMKKQATYAAWDFNDVWEIIEDVSYPDLINKCNDVNVYTKIYYVDDDAPNDPGPGDTSISDPNENGSSEHPFDNIQEAIYAVYDEGICYPEVLVRDGWYDGEGNYDIETLGLDVVIQSEHGPLYTVIDPYGQGRGFIIKEGETENTIIDGFTIFDGYANVIMLDDLPYHFGGAIICVNSSPVIQNCEMIFNYAYDSGGAIHLDRSDATIRRCEIILNECGDIVGEDEDIEAGGAGGGINTYQSNPLIENCVIAGNYGYYSGGITCGADSNLTINNCTIGDNYASDGPDGLECYYNSHADVKNSIFWTDTRWWLWGQTSSHGPNTIYQKHIFLLEDSSLDISYCDIEGGQEGVSVEDANCVLEWGVGNLNADPCFAEYYFFDYHLKSAIGRWTLLYESNGDYNNDWTINFKDFAVFALYWMEPNVPIYVDLDNDGSLDTNDLEIFCSRWLGEGENFSGWVIDDVNSPCIDAGDPCSPYELEPLPNGGRVNMGAYGNTEQASLSVEIPEPKRHPDLDQDGDVDFADFARFANEWLKIESNNYADFDYSGYVDEADLLQFCIWWLWPANCPYCE